MMSDYPPVILKPGREVPLLAGHPWVFSQGVYRADAVRTGNIVEIHSTDGRFLGLGTYHAGNTIRIRLLSDIRETVDTGFFTARLLKLRDEKLRYLPPETDGYRLVHADADRLPGLVVDVYDKTAVFQIHTSGMEPHRGAIVEALAEGLGFKAVVERSDIDSRRQEGLLPAEPRVHRGIVDGPVRFREAGLLVAADVLKGQKTGFFLDQRDARIAVGGLSEGRVVTNLFSYSCAFGLSAASGGAASVLNIDASRPALELGKMMFAENGFTVPEGRYGFEAADVFDFLESRPEVLEESRGRNLLICDPPAFAKSSSRLEAAKKAYTGLNRLCFESLAAGDILVTSSCSGMLSEDAFRDLLRHAAGWAKRNVRILRGIGQPVDHTRTLAFPEGRYLKTLILEVLS